ncbi:Na(+)/dicarboxylate cotransporter 3-like [Haemaphysalis longicornis]
MTRQRRPLTWSSPAAASFSAPSGSQSNRPQMVHLPACLASKTLGLHLFRAALVATSAALTVAASLVHSDPLKCCFFLISLGALVLCGPLPAPVAALFPVFVLPLIGLAASEEVAKIYLEMPQLSFLSVMFVVIAASKNGVYNRLALLILCNVGSSTSALLLLVMVPAVLLSLVVDHYLSSMLLMPIVDSLVDEIFTGRDKEAKPEPGDRRPKRTNLFSPPTQLVLQESSPQPHTPFKSAHIDKSENTEDKNRLRRALFLGLVYGSIIGCTATPESAVPSKNLVEFLDETYPLQHAVTFSSWVIYSLPGMIACCGVLWWYLSRHALPATLHEIRRDAYRVKYRHLGPIRFCETAVLLVTCGTLISHWATGGWYELLHNPKPLVPRTALLLAVGSLVFVVPAHPLEGLDSPPLLSWSAFREWMPWGCLLLCGAGMAVSHFAKVSKS